MKVFSTALILNAAAAATTANDGAADALRSPSLVTADLVYVATDADASSNQNDVIENQADAADEIEKKNDAPKFLRGIQLEEGEQCTMKADIMKVQCEDPDANFDFFCKNFDYTRGYCQETYKNSNQYTIYCCK